MLKINDLNVFYGGIHALKGISIEVEKGQIVSVIGSNGAGKSSLMNAISSTIKYKGSIEFCGKPLTTKAYKVVEAGISHVPEGRLIFANLTTYDNLRMGAYLRKDAKGITEDMERVYTIFPRLKERARQPAGTLSGGEQQMLAMGRGLMSNPMLLLLDEPSLGLAPLLINTIFEIILEIQKMGTTILLVEQNAFKALSIADKAYVFNQGCVSMSGDAAAIMADPSIREAYLGKTK
jgi:branched-chain amino acid transport system ATP-binding protein